MEMSGGFDQSFATAVRGKYPVILHRLKTLIVGTLSNCLAEAVLTSTHNSCFEPKIRKLGIPLHTQFYYMKVGFKGVFIARACFPGVKYLNYEHF